MLRLTRMLSLSFMFTLHTLSAANPVPAANVNAKDANGRTPLYYVSTKRDAKTLLDAGAEIENKDSQGETPLHWAAMNGSDEVLGYLLFRGASVDARDNQGLAPLHWAVRRGDMEAAKSLLAAGADVNARSQNGLTPLHLAAAQDDRLVVEFLLAKGALANAADSKGQTPAFHAAAAGERKTLSALLSKGADINFRDKEGNTPLALAVLFGRKHLARFMVSAGADPKARNKAGKLPTDFAQDDSSEQLAAFLATQEPPVAQFKLVWNTPLPEYFFPTRGSWLAAKDGHLYVAGLDLDLASGKPLRSLWKSTEYNLALEEVVPGNDRVLLLARLESSEEPSPKEFERRRRLQNERVLVALDGQTGKRRWRIKGQIPPGVIMIPGHVFLVRDDALLAVDAVSGKVLWRAFRSGTSQNEGIAASDRVVVNQPSTEGENDSVYLVQAYSVGNGRRLWTTRLAGNAFGAPATGDGCFYVGRETTIPAADSESKASKNFTVWALDETTGKTRWHREFKGQSSSTPLVYFNGRVYVVTNKNIHALSGDTGELQWSQEIANENVNHDSTPVVAGDLVLLWHENLEELEKSSTSRDYSLLALDAATGAIRWTYPYAALHLEESDSSPTLSRPIVRNGTLVFSDGSRIFRLERSADR